MQYFKNIWRLIHEYSVDFLSEYGFLGISIMSFTEGFLNPLPIAFVLAFSVHFLKINVISAFLIILITNIMGAIFGYFLGLKMGHPVFVKIFGNKASLKIEKFFEKWGIWSVMIAAITPFPFKIITWAAGIFRMNFVIFLLTSIIGRVIHFLIVIIIMYFFEGVYTSFANS